MSQQTWIYKSLADCSPNREQSVFSSHSTLKPALFPLFLFSLLLICLSGCCSKPGPPDISVSYSAQPLLENISPGHLPSFDILSANQPFNKIGTPEVVESAGEATVQVNNGVASLYFEEDTFSTNKDSYTNCIYRIHFSKVPFEICNFNITTGNNPGLLIIYTINQYGKIVLITTVHTCGCYLAFFPTTDLAKDAFPENWPTDRQSIHGYQLPSIIPAQKQPVFPYTFTLADGTHRVAGVALATQNHTDAVHKKDMIIRPMDDLYLLPYKDKTISFFESEGPRAGYVKNNIKILERLLISWWAFDWYVGEDKAYGKKDTSTIHFYTSLKFWQRKNSDMKNFPRFLTYWGWNL